MEGNINYSISLSDNYNPVSLFGFNPPIIRQERLWGGPEYKPYIPPYNELMKQYEMRIDKVMNLYPTGRNYLNKDLIPDNHPVDGSMEFPQVLQFKGYLPEYVIPIDERTPSNPLKFGMGNFTQDKVLLHRTWNQPYRFIKRAAKYSCVFAPQFSVFMDSRECEAIEAVRMNRTLTVWLQTNGIPTIQTVSLTAKKFYHFAFDGLAPNSPVGFDNMRVPNDPGLRKILRMGIEELLERKSPTMLIVVGYPLHFDPGIPVVYYESRIQKFHRHGYGKKS